MSSEQVATIALYSALADEEETTVCFLDFQEIKEVLRKMQKPVTDLRMSGQAP